MGNPVPEQIENRRPTAESTQIAEHLFNDVDFRSLSKLKETYPSEVVVSGGVQHNDLPGNCSLDTTYNKRTGESTMTVGYTNPTIKCLGPHDTVSVNSDGTITTNSMTNGKFQIRKDGDRQIVTMPSGDQVVVQGGRIVEATTGGKKTEFLTPKEAERREAERARERERSLQDQITKAAGGIADQIVDGKIPSKEIAKLFGDAEWGFYGKNGSIQLARAINNELRSQGSPDRVAVYQDRETGAVEVRVRTPDGVTTIDVPQKMMDLYKKSSSKVFGR